MSIIDTLQKKLGVEPPTVSICMMGPRAVGKTTVVTSIFSKSQETVGDSKIFITPANANANELPSYESKLVAAIERQDHANLPATEVESDFLFDLGILGKPSTVKMSIQDYPGEYLTSDDSAKKQKLNDFAMQSHIILVAIDTPYLMEDDGRFNSEKNLPEVVMSYLTKHPDEISNKLVMFIPLKCERYYYENRMNEVADRVLKTYKLEKSQELRSFFDNNNVASVIAPILSLGGIEFDKMVDNTSGRGIISKLPQFRMYEANPTYNPLFCSQPFYYLLTYVSRYYKWQRNQTSGFFARLRNSLNSYLTSDNEFLTEIGKMHTRILTNKHGYKVVTNNSIINF